ncbi:MAG TPA: translation initiation factor IF-2 subunit alpha [Candidatus Nanoarchaeia archaeon]|nr:translation initiation factor IF-2 subunit alpha [Candidatus Nanoarchaeia archaeon]
MLLVKKGFPEEGELLMCTVTNIQYHSVFVGIDEYQKTGLIHISEIAPGRIRNIRDYVEEGKKVICKVLKVDTEKGHIDLSLRRVNEGQKRAKVNEVKQHQKCEKIIEMVARAMKKDLKALFAEVSDNALKKYDTLYSCFEEVATDKVKLKDLGIEEKAAKALTEAIKVRIKEAEVTIGGELFLSSYAPDGINIIKESLKKVKEVSDKISVSYLGSGRYQVTVTAPDYKEAEKLLEKSTEDALEYIHDKKGIGDFKREAKA